MMYVEYGVVDMAGIVIVVLGGGQSYCRCCCDDVIYEVSRCVILCC